MSAIGTGPGEWPWAAHLEEPVDRDALVAQLGSGSLAREFAATASSAGDFEVIAFPLRLAGENGGPARVVASLAP